MTNRAGTFFAKRKTSGRFSEMDEQGAALRSDRSKKAKAKTKSGFGDQGDNRRKAAKKR